MIINKIGNKIIKSVLPMKSYAKLIGVRFGKNCDFYRNIFFGSEPYLIEIGDNVRITDGVKFITHDGGVIVLRNMDNNSKIDVFGKIKIGNNVHIGMDSIIMPGVTVGDNVVIGCGSVVTKSVPNNTVVAGVPARVIESIDEYREKCYKKCDYTKQMTSKKKKKYLREKYRINE